MTLDLTLYPIALLAIVVITQICKHWVKPKWGNIGVQVFIAFLSFLVAGIWITKTWFTTDTIAILTSLWIAANGIYQVIGKYIFGSLKKTVELIKK